MCALSRHAWLIVCSASTICGAGEKLVGEDCVPQRSLGFIICFLDLPTITGLGFVCLLLTIAVRYPFDLLTSHHPHFARDRGWTFEGSRRFNPELLTYCHHWCPCCRGNTTICVRIKCCWYNVSERRCNPIGVSFILFFLSGHEITDWYNFIVQSRSWCVIETTYEGH